MLVQTIRRPGQKGTDKLLLQYGDRLVCVRYRCDPIKGKRYKTVELIIAEQDWQPPAQPGSAPDPPPKPSITALSGSIVGVRIDYHETDLQSAIRSIGGRWSKQERLWFAHKEHVERIGLADRIVGRY